MLGPKFSELCEILEVCGRSLTLKEFDTDKVLTASHDAVRASILSRPEVSLQAEPFANLPNTQNAESSGEDLEIGRVENIRLFSDNEWMPFSASQIPSLTDFDFTPPTVVSTLLSQA